MTHLNIGSHTSWRPLHFLRVSDLDLCLNLYGEGNLHTNAHSFTNSELPSAIFLSSTIWQLEYITTLAERLPALWGALWHIKFIISCFSYLVRCPRVNCTSRSRWVQALPEIYGCWGVVELEGQSCGNPWLFHTWIHVEFLGHITALC